MSYLIDTCILSDVSKKADDGLVAWAAAQNPLDLYLSVLSLAEIQKGIDLLPNGDKRRSVLDGWLRQSLPAQFASRILPIGDAVAFAYGHLAAAGQRTGRPLPTLDGLLLATAQVHDFTLVTRNLRDVEGRGVPVLNPYTNTRP